MIINDVWSWNFHTETSLIEQLLNNFSYISIDTEFPGFLHNSARHDAPSKRYSDLKHNVDHLKIIQLGLTFSDANGYCAGTWQFNFSDFDPQTDPHVSSSIELLRHSGIDFDKNKLQGVDSSLFSKWFNQVMLPNQELRWITFHGVYDLAYMIKIVLNKQPMPFTVGGFLRDVGIVFARVYDAKFVARFCEGLLDGELGLNRLAKILNVERCVGEAHQAGSDSFLTACVFWRMKEVFEVEEDGFEGCLYGVDQKIDRRLVLLRQGH